MFGLCCAIPNPGLHVVWEAKMSILILKVFAMWSVVSTMTSLGVGVVIRRGDRVRKDRFLSCVFASLERLQASRS